MLGLIYTLQNQKQEAANRTNPSFTGKWGTHRSNILLIPMESGVP